MLSIYQLKQFGNHGVTLHPEIMHLTFPTWRRALKKLSSSWRVHAAHCRVAFFAIKMNIAQKDQENPAQANEEFRGTKWWGNKPGF
jgi:hypothetical protein